LILKYKEILPESAAFYTIPYRLDESGHACLAVNIADNHIEALLFVLVHYSPVMAGTKVVQVFAE
jgi:hypothetical protein